jgi:hypothetical protein
LARINVSFKENEKEQKLYKDIKDNCSDKSAFMKEAARYYLDHVKIIRPPKQNMNLTDADEGILNLLV